MSNHDSVSNTLDAKLDPMRFYADPHADAAIAKILGPHEIDVAMSQADQIQQWQPQWQQLGLVTKVFNDWHDNDSIMNWRAEMALKYGLSLEAGQALENYVAAAKSLPEWANRDQIAHTETLFVDYGVLSLTLLFCASLPACYVVPDLAAVLQATGQLENHTEHRVRSTGAMVFPVMMPGGLMSGAGSGIAQIFKVRLIHATIRHLILRQSPDDAMVDFHTDQTNDASDSDRIPQLASISSQDPMYQALVSHGWNIQRLGLPCNQEELAYTLLTFSYVYLCGMRKLGIGLPQQDEEAYLHTWNVAGHFLGIQRSLMAETMQEAEALFATMQGRGRKNQLMLPVKPDPRPALGVALMNAMASVIPSNMVKTFPTLMTQYLCGKETSRDLGLDKYISMSAHIIFLLVLGSARGIDWLVRKFFPEFSISRLITRIVGYHLITKLMMSQTRPLRLPETVSTQMNSLLGQWGNDNHAAKWINAIEDFFHDCRRLE